MQGAAQGADEGGEEGDGGRGQPQNCPNEGRTGEQNPSRHKEQNEPRGEQTAPQIVGYFPLPNEG